LADERSDPHSATQSNTVKAFQHRSPSFALFAWAENKRLKVLLADLCKKKTLLAGWK
jgi:hypothetical protein